MNTKSIAVAAAIAVLGAGGTVVYAQPAATEQAGQPAAVEAVEVGNKICPVSKEKVGEMGEAVKYEYNGKIYNLCCPACKKDFAGDPEKYSKIAEDEVAATAATEVK
ncbi:MAG TPA: hypothetical protein DE315_00670 [Candidatus Omnitrophica bacterium]|nr:hypothetical protein [Candidatus Omnitrophota bacterium]HCI44036.1 hypothetical protein [Candidatus Omnitrophota bacterium]